jgi:CRP-like cAMP-binding protein
MIINDMTGSPDDQTAVEVLSSVASFEGLDATALETLARAAIRKEFAADQVVFLGGEPCAGLYLVQSGWLKSVKTSPTGREQVMRIVGPGEVFNEMGVLVGEANFVTVIALEPATVWVIQRITLMHLMEEHPRLSRISMQNLAKRMQHLIRLVEDLSLRTVESRLARLLLDEAATDVWSGRQWATQAELAARLGTVPDVLNRALRSLAEEGLVQIERRRIRVLDRAGLENRASLGN